MKARIMDNPRVMNLIPDGIKREYTIKREDSLYTETCTWESKELKNKYYNKARATCDFCEYTEENICIEKIKENAEKHFKKTGHSLILMVSKIYQIGNENSYYRHLEDNSTTWNEF